MQGLRLLLLLACASGVLTSLPLPSYVKPCAKSDPKFSECAKSHAQEVLSHPALVRGDAKYKVPPLNPLKITKLVAEENGMTITLTDLNIYGLLGATVNNISCDFENQHMVFMLYFPFMSTIGKYETDGRLLQIPIQGRGDINATRVNIQSTFEFDYTLETRDGKQYMVPKNPVITSTTSRSYIHLTNLFNGNELLGNQINNFLNENWKELDKQLSPSLNVAISKIISSIVEGLSSVVPYDVIFPERLP